MNIEVDISPNLPAVPADDDRLAQVFTNRMDNALKFTLCGGLIPLYASAENNEMLIAVTDTGAGIPEEAQAHIFGRFYQAAPARRGGEKHGADLELAIAHEIIQTHGGRISVRSRLGREQLLTLFCLLFPKLRIQLPIANNRLPAASSFGGEVLPKSQE